MPVRMIRAEASLEGIRSPDQCFPHVNITMNSKKMQGFPTNTAVPATRQSPRPKSEGALVLGEERRAN